MSEHPAPIPQGESSAARAQWPASADPPRSASERARLWSLIQERIKKQLGLQRYGIWFGRTELTKVEDSMLVVGVPNVVVQQYLNHRYKATVRRSAEQLLGRAVEVGFEVEPRLFREMRAERKDQAPSRPVRRQEACLPSSGASCSGLSRAAPQGFEELVVTPSNRFPFNVARDIAQGAKPHSCFLLVLGGHGSGKTALLQATHRGALESGVARRAECVMAEHWCNDFYHAVQDGKTWPFRHHYRNCDMLLVDGVEFLQGKPAAQDELLYTVKTLLSGGGRLVLSSAVHPEDLQEAKASFKTLLSGAFWVQLVVPPPSECEELARGIARAHGLKAADEVFRYLAEKHSSSLQELSGVICSLAGYAALHGRARADMALVREALGATSRARRRPPAVGEIRKVIVGLFPVTETELTGKSRRRSVNRARQIGMYLAHELTGASLSEIGRSFGGRTHSTVKHAIDRVHGQLEADPETEDLVKRCREKLQ